MTEQATTRLVPGRIPIAAANWKMAMTLEESRSFARGFEKEMGSVIKHSPELKKIAWDQYQLLDEGPIHIVVVKIGASYKLVFWENVNQLLKESRGTAPTKASGNENE